MLTCKQVSKALAENDYQELSFFKRWALRLHVALCVVCKGYNGNVMLFQDMARAFRRYEDKPLDEHAPDAAKNKWLDSIKAASGQNQR
jgi:hypothetical protein